METPNPHTTDGAGALGRPATASYVEAPQDGTDLRTENERLRGELETALAWHEVALSREREAYARLGGLKKSLRRVMNRATLYAHDATGAGHAEAVEGFYEISGQIKSIMDREVMREPAST